MTDDVDQSPAWRVLRLGSSRAAVTYLATDPPACWIVRFAGDDVEISAIAGTEIECPDAEVVAAAIDALDVLELVGRDGAARELQEEDVELDRDVVDEPTTGADLLDEEDDVDEPTPDESGSSSDDQEEAVEDFVDRRNDPITWAKAHLKRLGIDPDAPDVYTNGNDEVVYVETAGGLSEEQFQTFKREMRRSDVWSYDEDNARNQARVEDLREALG